MSQIYLTKIERKTIFTRSLIFVLIMVLISDLTVTGPFWFNFVPWLYVLGIIGSIKKIDSILMGIIGTFTVFVSSIIANQSLNLDCIIDTVCALILLVLGIVTGKIIFEFILEHRLVKYLRRSKKTIYVILSMLMLVVSFAVVGVKDGNLISYISSKNNLDKYITSTYGKKEYIIISTMYNKQAPGKYVYVVKLDEQEVKFVPVTTQIFKDANLEERLNKENEILKSETKSTIDYVLSNGHELLKDAHVYLNKEYTKMGVVPDLLVLYISIISQDESKDLLYEQISNVIEEIKNTQKIDKVIVTIDGQTLQITEMDKINKDYLMLGFDIKELDE